MKRKLIVCFLVLALIAVPLLAVACEEEEARPLVVGVLSEPDIIDPTSTTYAPANYPISMNIFDTLVGFTPDGTPTPGIATWEILEGGTVFEFTLREGVEFHSGDPLTTADVEFSHNRSMEYSFIYGVFMSNLDRLEVVDDYTIRFVFKSPDILFLPMHMLLIVSKSYYDRVGEEVFHSDPVGTGPYKYVDWVPGQYIDLVANEDYWGGEPSAKEVRLLFVKEDATRAAMLQAGEVDLICDTPWEVGTQLEEEGFKLAKIGSNNIAITFHTLNPDVPWYDKRVRQAIAYAIDREAIVNDLFQGIPQLNAWLAPGEIGYDPDLEPYPYDTEKAQELLAEAAADGVFVPNNEGGFDMPLYYVVGATAQEKEVAEAVALYLNAVGIKCDVEGVDAGQMSDNQRSWHEDTTAEAVFVGTPAVANQPDPVRGLSLVFHSSSPICTHFFDEVDALIDEALVTIDDTARGELIKQCFEILNDEMPNIQILTAVRIYAMQPDVEFTPTEYMYGLILVKDISFD